MCTISFVPKLRGFYLAMNRDEKFTRSTALPPAIVDLADRRAIFPREPEGGTWIAANDAGVCLALVNWHRIERQPVRSIASRGQVVKALAAKSSDEEIAAGLAALPLSLTSTHGNGAIGFRRAWMSRRLNVNGAEFAKPRKAKNPRAASIGCAACTDRTPQSADRSPFACIDPVPQQ